MSAAGIQFDAAFHALTNHWPLRWQHRLFNRLRSGEKIPGVCDLPTGLGKTSVIPIWVIAVAQQAQDGSVTLPRRLVYVVNRRTVVDQATSVVEEIRERLLAPNDSRWSSHEEVLRSLAGSLQELAAGEGFLAVSTLRGELADNEEWKADPARPAIIVGTIDMVGSKLLFSGYGDGRYWRAQHAGLIGQDSLIVHDEAHLTPAFSEVLHHLAEEQRQSREPRPLHVMELSATLRDAGDDVLKLEPEDEKDEVVKDRLDATKRLHLHSVEQADVDKLVKLSTAHEDEQARVLVYVRSPEEAQQVADQLHKQLRADGETRIAILTGTIRGYERDQLVRTNPVFRALLNHESSIAATVYLVSTSAGEVGIDLDADHVVCDLTTLDSMIQRLGRVNRRGGQGRVARVDVVVQSEAKAKDKQSELDKSIDATSGILNRWISAARDRTIDVSPRSLRRLVDGLDREEREKTFAPKPAVPPLTDILLDAWSLTSIVKQMPGRPEVAPYLHGLTNDPPETYVAWRKEVALLSKAEADSETLRDWFLACSIQACERLRDRTDRVKRTLEGLLKTHRKKDEDRDFPVVVLNERGEAEWSRLSRIVGKGFNLAYRTIVLPVEAGGLNAHGALDIKTDKEAVEVAEATSVETKGQVRERWLLIRDGDRERYERLITGENATSLPEDLGEEERVTLQEPLEGGEQEGGSRYLLVMVEPRRLAVEQPETAKTKQTLSWHSGQIGGQMSRIADALGLEPSLKEALTLAARWHDRGKNRPVWQRFACNPNGVEALAKSTKYLHGRALGGYRHEFGSLLEAEADHEIGDRAESDLILHLMAAHHGWARPHFEPKAWDNAHTTAENDQEAAEVLRRFGRLQQRFGRWGLAWLESLLRCADIAASKQIEDSLDAAQGQLRP
jgi:CRISPR-associated endonuclease/helicase Cas3